MPDILPAGAEHRTAIPHIRAATRFSAVFYVEVTITWRRGRLKCATDFTKTIYGESSRSSARRGDTAECLYSDRGSPHPLMRTAILGKGNALPLYIGAGYPSYRILPATRF